MKKVGLIGGISWVSTMNYYKFINEGVNAKLGGLNFAECIIYSLNFGDIQANSWDNSFELLTKGTEEAGLNLSYTPNKYTEIKDFPTGYYSKYHSVKQRYLDEPAQLGKLSTTACSVEYYHSTGFYTIQKHEEVIEKTLIKNMSLYSIIGLSLAIAIAFLLRYIMPYSGKSESLFNKKWKNIESNSILMIEAKMFGRNKVVLTENDKAKKGIAKIADNGSTIQLSFIDSDYFYKVQHLSLFKLELENLVSNTIVKYEILGSNAYPKKEV